MSVNVHRAWRPHTQKPNRRKPSKPPTHSSDEESVEKFEEVISLSSLDSKESDEESVEKFEEVISLSSLDSKESDEESVEKFDEAISLSSMDSEEDSDEPTEPFSKRKKTEDILTAENYSDSEENDAYTLQQTSLPRKLSHKLEDSLQISRTQSSKQVTDDTASNPIQKSLRIHKRATSPKTSTSRCTDEPQTYGLQNTCQAQLQEQRTSASKSEGPTQLRGPQTSASKRKKLTKLRQPQTSTSRNTDLTKPRKPRTSALRNTGSTQAQEPQTSASSSANPKQLRELQPSASKSEKQKPERNKYGETPLQEACKKGDLDTVRNLRKQGHSINVQDKCGWTPLHEASGYELTKYLLDEGADIDHRGGPLCGGITPLMDAAKHGLLDLVNLLLQYGADADIKDAKHKTALDHLLEWRNKQRKKERKLSDETERYFTATVAKLEKSTSVKRGKPLSTVERIFQLKYKYKRKTSLGELRKRKAAVRPKSDCQQLVECSSSVCKKKNRSVTVSANKEDRKSSAGKSKAVKDAKGDKGKGEKGATAAPNEEKEDAGPTPPLERQKYNDTTLHVASKQGDVEIVRKLREQGHNVNSQDKHGRTPLHVAAGYKLIKFLLDEGADIDHTGGPKCMGMTPLMNAARFGQLDTVNILLEFGANADIKDKTDNKALNHLLEWKEKQRRRNNLNNVDNNLLTATTANLEKKTTVENGDNLLSGKEKVRRTLTEVFSFTNYDIEQVIRNYGQKCLESVEIFCQLQEENSKITVFEASQERKETVIDLPDNHQQSSKAGSNDDSDCSVNVAKTANKEEVQNSVNSLIDHRNSKRELLASSYEDVTPSSDAIRLSLEADITLNSKSMTGFQVVSTNYVVLISSKSTLSLYNVETRELLDQKEYFSPISDLTSLGVNRLAVLQPDEKKIRVLSTADSLLSEVKEISTEKYQYQYDCISGCEKNLLVLCKLEVPDLALIELGDISFRRIYTKTLPPLSNVAVSCDGQCIYLSEKCSIIKMDIFGKQLAKFTTDGTYTPTFLQPLSDDSLVVCYTDKRKIERIKRDCQTRQVLRLDGTELWGMQGIGYDMSRERLFLVCANSKDGIPNHIKVFRVNW